MPRERPARAGSSVTPDISCERVTRVLLDYLSGDLDRETTRAFQRHLRECPDCVAFLNTYKESVRATRSLRSQQIPPELKERVLQFLRKKIDYHPRRR